MCDSKMLFKGEKIYTYTERSVLKFRRYIRQFSLRIILALHFVFEFKLFIFVFGAVVVVIVW
jgi:hypothetical protein